MFGNLASIVELLLFVFFLRPVGLKCELFKSVLINVCRNFTSVEKHYISKSGLVVSAFLQKKAFLTFFNS